MPDATVSRRPVAKKGVHQIGNVIDWVPVDREVFVGSAIADVSVGVFNAVRDLRDGSFKAGMVHKVGLSDPTAVRLSMASQVAPEVRQRIERAAEDIRAGRVHVPESYDGPEFAPPAG